MAENEATPGAAPGAQAPQAKNPITVNLQYIKDLSFENPKAPASIAGQKEPPQVNVQVEVKARNVGPNMFESIIEIHAEAKTGGDTMFVVELSYAGIFTLDGVPENAVAPVVLIECPRLLFPFARGIIANATRDGGFPPLMVNPVDFVDMYRRNQAAQQAAQAQQGGAAPAPTGPSSPLPGAGKTTTV